MRNNWTDQPCYYVSIIDADRQCLAVGPFRSEHVCRQFAYRSPDDGGIFPMFQTVLRAAERIDPRAHFYSYGMVQMPNGYRSGVLNSLVPEYESNHSI